MIYEDLLERFNGRLAALLLGLEDGESVEEALERLAREAVAAVTDGAQCLVLDDDRAGREGLGWLDPHLATSKIDTALRKAPRAPGEANLRRRTGLVVRSAAVRTLHDLALLCGFGADGINAYALTGVCLRVHEGGMPAEEVQPVLLRLAENLTGGLLKVTSTMGCHELRGYGRACSAIGLAPSVAAVFGAANYFGSEEAGVTWGFLNEDAACRKAELKGERPVSRLEHYQRFYPHFWKKAAAYARSEAGYAEVRRTFQTLSAETPVALRHLLGIKHVTDVIDPSDVTIAIGDYTLPIVIDAMSYGSQGEASFRSYIHAASLLNIICINGEGGELPEILGLYRKNRGQQVASGRFGVNVDFLNSAAVMEIKIGQGAKPGEGGMLPGYKVTPRVAQARHTPAFVTLLSPSNNHDLYSIEDLAQLIEELRMVNPQAKISVKVPVVPGIGVIAVGIAKAGSGHH